eukprot:309351-Amphidinium_carterae.2
MMYVVTCDVLSLITTTCDRPGDLGPYGLHGGLVVSLPPGRGAMWFSWLCCKMGQKFGSRIVLCLGSLTFVGNSLHCFDLSSEQLSRAQMAALTFDNWFSKNSASMVPATVPSKNSQPFRHSR